MGKKENKTPRKRLGEWTREERETTVPGGKLPYTVVVVKHLGQTWERPDTKEGRAAITAAIQSMERSRVDQQRILRIQAQIVELGKRLEVEAGKCLAHAAGQLSMAVDLMRKE